VSTTITRAALRALAGRGATIRRRPSFGPRDRARVDHAPTMAPTRGLTPAVGGGPGPKTYVWHDVEWVAWARWDDERDRVPVVWVSAAWWAAAGGWPAARYRTVAA
jgi:hypothetical protein